MDEMNAAAPARHIELGPRLCAALELLVGSTPAGERVCVADIGCDHGRLSAALLQRNAARRVIASDISAASLEKARSLAQSCGLDGRLECRLSDGFSAYSENEVQCAVIAGMGGELIVDILRRHERIVRGLSRIVMQPMRGEAELRGYLYGNGYRIIDERVVYDGGRYYQLICARTGCPSALPDYWPPDFYQFGAAAFEKRESCMRDMMQRYYDILCRKLDAATLRGVRPVNLVHEAECTGQLLDILRQNGI